METWAANFEEEFIKWNLYHIKCNLYDMTEPIKREARFASA